MSSADDLPSGQITKYDKASYVRLTSFVSDSSTEMEKAFLKPGSGLTLDGTLSTVIKVGSPDWAPAKGVTDQAGKFGLSVNTELNKLYDDWTRYVKALATATKVFDDTSDLATVTASDFTSKYPGLANKPGA